MYSQPHFNKFDLQPLPQDGPWAHHPLHNLGLQSLSAAPPHTQTSIVQTAIDVVGRPIHFQSGPYTGRTIRMELIEIQKADLGRKYARVDRRPLDPPPVVLLKAFEVLHAGTSEEEESEFESEDIQALGLLCTVDLFPVPDQGPSVVDANPPEDLGRIPSADTTTRAQGAFLLSPSLSSSSSIYNEEPDFSNVPQRFDYRRDFTVTNPSASHGGVTGNVLPSTSFSDVIHHVDGYPITEESKRTHALVGETFVQPVMIDYQGGKALVFVFSDISVKLEGQFILRYRAFDIFAQLFGDLNDSPVSTACYGGTFRIYSTKKFPGLSASTELTKRLLMWGVRVNTRITDRRRRRKAASRRGKRSPSVEYFEPDDE